MLESGDDAIAQIARPGEKLWCCLNALENAVVVS
jgi:hypothetical protein